MVLICPFGSQYMIHGTSDSMLHIVTPEYSNFDPCH